jgi:DNA-binding GntR family transcriptional regulator
VAAELGISIAPVLEAMVRLEAEGLLTSLPRKGTQVRLVRPEDTADQLVLREAIECQAARMYCGAPIEGAETQLKELGSAVDNSNEGAVKLWQCEIAFHRRLVELSGSRALLGAFQQAMHLGTLCAVNFYSDLHPADNPQGNHIILVDSLKTTDPELAEKAMREHLRGGKKQLFQAARRS